MKNEGRDHSQLPAAAALGNRRQLLHLATGERGTALVTVLRWAVTMEESTVERAAKNKAVRRYLYKQDIPAAFEVRSMPRSLLIASIQSILTGLAVEKPENVKAYVLDKLKQIKDHSGLLDWSALDFNICL